MFLVYIVYIYIYIYKELPLLHHLNVRENAILKLDDFRGLLKLRIGSLTAL